MLLHVHQTLGHLKFYKLPPEVLDNMRSLGLGVLAGSAGVKTFGLKFSCSSVLSPFFFLHAF